jgi:hypothetical protein
MKKCAPIIALSLGACGPSAMQAVDERMKQDLRGLVAEFWESYEARMRQAERIPPGRLEFVDIDEVRCETVTDAFACDFQITARTETGELTKGRGWGSYAYYDDQLVEVFMFG